jgi:hypothetical protein
VACCDRHAVQLAFAQFKPGCMLACAEVAGEDALKQAIRESRRWANGDERQRAAAQAAQYDKMAAAAANATILVVPDAIAAVEASAPAAKAARTNDKGALLEFAASAGVLPPVSFHSVMQKGRTTRSPSPKRLWSVAWSSTGAARRAAGPSTRRRASCCRP